MTSFGGERLSHQNKMKLTGDQRKSNNGATWAKMIHKGPGFVCEGWALFTEGSWINTDLEFLVLVEGISGPFWKVTRTALRTTVDESKAFISVNFVDTMKSCTIFTLAVPGRMHTNLYWQCFAISSSWTRSHLDRTEKEDIPFCLSLGRSEQQPLDRRVGHTSKVFETKLSKVLVGLLWRWCAFHMRLPEPRLWRCSTHPKSDSTLWPDHFRASPAAHQNLPTGVEETQLNIWLMWVRGLFIREGDWFNTAASPVSVFWESNDS